MANNIKIKTRGGIQKTRMLVVMSFVAAIGTFFIVASHAATPTHSLSCASNETNITVSFSWAGYNSGIRIDRSPGLSSGGAVYGSTSASGGPISVDGGAVAQGTNYSYGMVDRSNGSTIQTISCALKSTTTTTSTSGGTSTNTTTTSTSYGSGTLSCSSNTTNITVSYSYSGTSAGIYIVRSPAYPSGTATPAFSATSSSGGAVDGGPVQQGVAYTYVMTARGVSGNPEITRTPSPCTLKTPTTTTTTTSAPSSTSTNATTGTSTTKVGTGTISCSSNTTNITVSYSYSGTSAGVYIVRQPAYPSGTATPTFTATASSGGAVDGGPVTAGTSYTYVMTARGVAGNPEITRTQNPCVLKDQVASATADDSSGDGGDVPVDDSTPLDFGAASDDGSGDVAVAYSDDSGLDVEAAGSNDGFFADDSGLGYAFDTGSTDYSFLDSNGNIDESQLTDQDLSQYSYDDQGNIVDTVTGEKIDPSSSRGQIAKKILKIKVARAQQKATATYGVSGTIAAIFLLAGIWIGRHRRVIGGAAAAAYDVSAYLAPQTFQPSPVMPPEPTVQPAPPVPAPNPAVDTIITNTFYPQQPQVVAPTAPPPQSDEPMDMYELANQHPETFGNMHRYQPDRPAGQQDQTRQQ